ncbi:hypothetical protein, partial [Plasmodium yoelii yoelii]
MKHKVAKPRIYN